VAVGDTLFDPLSETAAPSNVTVVAFDVVHVNIDDCPLAIDIGDAVSLAVGIVAGGGAVVDTVTVTDDSTSRSPLTASTSYFLV
jgi:hypothetical protein